jgi:uncharacterized protein (TIGR02302 family)
VASWPIRVAVDALPSIAFTEPLRGGRNGLLHIAAQASDDYGIAAAWVEIRRDSAGPAVTVTLPVPADHPRRVAFSVWRDLTAEPWAGLPVTLQPMVRDTAGQVAAGGPVTVRLPQRHFTDPAARALIEQRRRITADRAAAPGAVRVLDAISRRPARFKNDLTAFLDMRLARRELATPSFDLAEVQDLMWQAALRIDEGKAGSARRALEAAAEALHQAVAGGASNREILALLDRVQSALDRLARSMPATPGAALAGAGDGRVISAEALKRMLDKMRALAESGSRAALQRMVRDLSRMMANLSVRPPISAAAQKALRDLREVTRRQQGLLDRSFRRDQRGVTPVAPADPFDGLFPPQMPRRSDSRGGRPATGRQAARDQAALQRRLGALNGAASARQTLAEAGRAMGRAVTSLKAGDWREAAAHQAGALRRLDQALRQMQAGSSGVMPADPLGRPLFGQAYGTNAELHIPGRATMRRAGEILRELRRRAGDWQRPPAERAYLDRLLRQF